MSDELVILHAGALGDLALTLQLLCTSRRVRDAGQVHLVSRSDPGDLSDCRPSVFRRGPEGLGMHWLYATDDCSPPAALAELIAKRTVISALGNDERLRQRILRLRPARLFSFEPSSSESSARHVTAAWRDQLALQSLPLASCPRQQAHTCTLRPGDELLARGQVARAAVCARKSVVLMHPGSGAMNKNWPLPNFDALAALLAAQGRCPVFVIGEVELEKWPADALALLSPHALIRNPAPSQLLEWLAGADVFVGNDSGPAHLAALLGAPTVCLFGPTRAAVWRPLGLHVAALQGDPRRVSDWGIQVSDVASRL